MTVPHRPVPLVQVGQIVEVPEAHYCYGTGDLLLLVTHVAPVQHPGLEWLRVRGMQIWDGRKIGERVVDVRVAAIVAGEVVVRWPEPAQP